MVIVFKFMAELIIIRGPLGIGKSTISKKLAKKLSAEYFSVDELLSKEKLAVIDWDLGFIPEQNFMKINDLIVPKIKVLLNDGISVVVDGNFYHKTVLEDLIERLNEFKPKVFTLKANKEICIKRDSERANPHGKDAAIAVHDLVNKFDYGISINNETSDVIAVLQEILNKL